MGGVEEERARAAKVQDALYRIAELASAAQDMQEFYRATHEIVGEFMAATNFFIALYDEERQRINWPYYVDEVDTDIPDPNRWDEFGSGNARGTTAYVLRTGTPQHFSRERLEELVTRGEFDLVGVQPEDALGVPLKTEGRTIGVLWVQSYTKDVRYTEQDKDLLAFVGQHVGAALSRARAIEETRQRNAELALINSVQSALAGELEMQAIYDVVGDKIQEVFDAQVVDIWTYDAATDLVHCQYSIERGERRSWEPYPLGSLGFMRLVIETGAPMLIKEDLAGTRERLALPRLSDDEPKSSLQVALLAGGTVTGLVALQNIDREHAFDEGDQRLLTTLAGSLSVALENARLVHETRQRNAELAVINSVQSALAGELEMQAIYDVVGDKIGEIFDAQGVVISVFDEATGLVHFPYLIEHGERLWPEPGPVVGFSKQVLESREPLLINENLAAEAERRGSTLVAGEMPKSALFVPLVTGGRATGLIALDDFDREHAFDEADQRLLATLAASLSVALENARLVHETRQRNAELALINSVQSALAGELEMQAIYNVVGDKIQEIFDAQGTGIGILDEATGFLSIPYLIERGERLHVEPLPVNGFSKHVLETCEPLLINENLAAEVERYGSTLVAGEIQKSTLNVPLITGGRATGLISLDNFDREHAFSESDQRLLTTLAGSLSVALENARLVHETRQRNAELALINSVQEALAGELEMQAIYDVVGDKIQEIFDAQVVDIGIYDFAAGLTRYPYTIERGVRFPEDVVPLDLTHPTARQLLETKSAVLIADVAVRDRELGRSSPVAEGTERPQSMLFAPLVSGDEVRGRISLQNLDRTNAFTDSDVRLLTTLASSLSVALENARLVHETRQRNAELALINGVQDAIAGELDDEAIYDAVGDRIRDIFDAQVVQIVTFDEAAGLLHYPYLIERGERLQVEPVPLGGFSKHVLETRESLLIVENLDVESEQYGSVVDAGERPRSVLFVPLIAGGKATGVISLQNVDREHAFGESDQQLLETLAGGLSVALENARLVHETRQRNAELGLINGVQDAIAGELEPQAIYDAVGDRIRDVFDAQAVFIATLDQTTGLMNFPYIIERGERMHAEPSPPKGVSARVVDTGESVLVTEAPAPDADQILAGEWPKSGLFVPLVTSGSVTGVVSLQNVDREHAFSESDQQLLETLAGSLSVALENARLVHETRQRNAELALINSVQDGIAGELDPQAIYDAVGDRIQEIFDAQVVSIRTVDEATGLMHYAYAIERGERLRIEPTVPIGFSKHVLESREPLLIVENMDAENERYGSTIIRGTDDTKSLLFVPLVSGGEATGLIGLENIDREHAFGESDQQLLETLAGSLSVALENARLVHETRQRNAELALINSVQDAIAGELDPQAIYDAVGDRIRDVFDAQVVSIATLDEASGLVHYAYLIERGDRLQAEPRPLAGFAKHVLETREPLLIVENLDAELERYGSSVVAGETAKSILFVPLVAGGKAAGVISLQNIDREHAFDEDAQRLLTTLAGSLAVALENARLVQETRQRLSELATVNSVGHALSSQLDPDALIELVGEHVLETFDADIAYVALHNEAAGQIDFAFYHESGQRLEEPSIAYGEGLTSRIIEMREPLLLNREEHYEGQASVGTPSRSYLGVPILVGSKGIGVISVQSIEEEGRFGEADVRLLATIAANVGVAIQNARLFTEVERQRGYLELLVAISPAAVIVMDVEERVTDWNPAAAELFGYSAEEAVGRRIDELVFGSSAFDTDEGREVTREALATGRAQRITRRRRRDGTLVDVEMMMVPLTVDGSHVGFLVMYHDVTELQRARQEAEAATQAKSAFLATMSHEIRTPMNAVIGMTDLLLGTELTEEQREFAEVVHSSGDALLHVIDDILDYSKIEAGKLDLEREPFSLRDCVEGALDIVAPRAWEKELELGCLIDERAPAGILGDEARLRQVLLNLLSNAVKFTERGEVFVLVNADETQAGSYQVELAVRDTGIGIPPDRMDRLFTSFSQVDASTTRRFGGTGLGLAISKRLVELMGGTISVDSEQDKGSVFRISLPAVAADVPAKIALEEGLPHLSGKRILIVDDNATNREIVTRHAQSWGMEPVAVELPAAALELIEEGEQFDVAVLDMMMPDMDGVALAREIRNRRSAEVLPLLLLTSVGRISQGESSKVFSAQLAKPLKASQLYNALLSLLTAGGVPEEGVAPVSDGKHARSTLRILLAEDNAMNQKVALRLLERLGYRADVAVNGLEALAALERQPYDVVLMDMQMPELDGLDATRRICEQWPPATRPHIVAMTANALPEDREACFAAGMNDYVAKPIRAEELAAALKRVKPKSLAAAANGSEGGDVKLDSAALASLRELGGDDFLREVIDAFLADAPELIATLRRSLDDGSSEELRRAAHTLKSNGATLGAGEFTELCRSLEQRAKAGELDDAAELVDRIEQEYRPLEGALASLRAGAPS